MQQQRRVKKGRLRCDDAKMTIFASDEYFLAA
jgi:hypothetical protein